MSPESSNSNISGNSNIKNKSVNDLIKSLTDSHGQYAFLIGAGTSKPAGIDTAADLIQTWQHKAYDLKNTDKSFEKWVNNKEKEMEKNQNKYGFWFEQVFATKEQRREYIEKDIINDATPEFGHIVLASMMVDEHGKKYVPLTLTPNFDNLLYDAFYHFVENRPRLINHNALATGFSLTDETPTIIKMHGDYLYQNVKNINTETNNLESDTENAIIQAIGEYGLVVVGYGGKDDSIMQPLINSTRSGSGVFWCVREGDELSDYTRELLEQPNTFRVNIEGSETLFSKLFARIDDLQTPQSENIIERAEQRARELSEKRTHAKRHAPEKDREQFEISDLMDQYHKSVTDNNYEKARAKLEEILKNEPEGSDIQMIYSTAHNNLGYLLEDKFDQQKKAKKHYERAIQIDPRNKSALNNLAALLQEEFDQPEAAKQYYERAIDVDSEFITALSNLAVLLQEEFDQPEIAKEYYERAIDIDPKYANPHNHYGWLLFKEYGKDDKAKEHLNRAIELDPKYAEAHYRYATLLDEEFDQPEETEHHYDKSKELGYN